MDIINPAAQDYAEKYSGPYDKLLKAIITDTEQSHADPHMLSGLLQGKLLEIFSMLLQPMYILEIGTFTGFSALCLVKGLKPGGELHTIEIRKEEADSAEKNFNSSNDKDRIILHRGNALEIIPGLQKTWDLVFIDADKTGYLDYYEMIFPRLRSGAVVLADNVLFHGQVLEEPVKGKNAKAIKAFNEYILNDNRVDKTLLTIRDGLMLIRKK